jgi:hypothetical protein
MKTVFVSKKERKIRELLDQAKEENIIVRSPDGREYILAEIDDFNREIELTRQNQKLMTFLEKRADQTKVTPLKDVKKQLI